MDIWNMQTSRVGAKGRSVMTLNLTGDASYDVTGTITYQAGVVGEWNPLMVDPEGANYNKEVLTYKAFGAWSQEFNDRAIPAISVWGVAPGGCFLAATIRMTGPSSAPTGMTVKINTIWNVNGAMTQDTLHLVPIAS